MWRVFRIGIGVEPENCHTSIGIFRILRFSELNCSPRKDLYTYMIQSNLVLTNVIAKFLLHPAITPGVNALHNFGAKRWFLLPLQKSVSLGRINLIGWGTYATTLRCALAEIIL